MGYFLRAKLLVAGMLEPTHPGTVKSVTSYIHTVLCHHNSHVQRNEWNSLPELTNSNGRVSLYESVFDYVLMLVMFF